MTVLLPSAPYGRDPPVDYQVHKAALHTMATCHSLRMVEEELVGDPLDLKMFEFTGWSFDEGGQSSGAGEDEEHNKLSPSVARPPAGMEYDIDDAGGGGHVRPSHVLYTTQLTDLLEFANRTGRTKVIRICLAVTQSQRRCPTIWRSWRRYICERRS